MNYLTNKEIEGNFGQAFSDVGWIPENKRNILNFLKQTRTSDLQAIMEIVKASRTVGENLGVGIREETARNQVIADLISLIEKE